MELVEHITWNGKTLASIIRAPEDPDRTTFLTPPEYSLQVGFVVSQASADIPRHVHRPLERHIVGTSEVLVVRKGRCLMDIYTDDLNLVATRELGVGDIIVTTGGGHGFRILEDVVFLEVKQGPYIGMDEKERF